MPRWAQWLALGIGILHIVSEGEATIGLAKRLGLIG
jgi:hypothetical protein